MKRTISKTQALTLAAGLLLGGAVMTVTSAGAHGGDASKVHACYKVPVQVQVRGNNPTPNTNPNVRIIGAGENCTADETPLDWNVQGAQGPKGDKGDKGDRGDAGPGGSRVIRVYGNWVDTGALTTRASASCPSGYTVIGGGGDAGSDLHRIIESLPSGNGWSVWFGTALGRQVRAVAICMPS